MFYTAVIMHTSDHNQFDCIIHLIHDFIYTGIVLRVCCENSLQDELSWLVG